MHLLVEFNEPLQALQDAEVRERESDTFECNLVSGTSVLKSRSRLGVGDGVDVPAIFFFFGQRSIDVWTYNG
ncbi:MAG TPA: hypothetical protein V6D11_33195 [Waterburya sp.]